jgi:hypothetical protein
MQGATFPGPLFFFICPASFYGVSDRQKGKNLIAPALKNGPSFLDGPFLHLIDGDLWRFDFLCRLNKANVKGRNRHIVFIDVFPQFIGKKNPTIYTFP